MKTTLTTAVQSAPLTAAQEVTKQKEIDKLQTSGFGRFVVKTLNAFDSHKGMIDCLKQFKSQDKMREVAKINFVNELKRYPETASNVLTVAEQYAVHTYTKQGYIGMNKALREPGTQSADDAAYFGELNQVATQALKKLSAAQEKFVLSFRGITGDMPHANLKAGDLYTEKAFMSTSAEVMVCKDEAFLREEDGFSPTMLYTFGKSGANVDTMSASEGEQEVLYKPGTQFRTVFSQKDHEVTTAYPNGHKETTRTNHVVLEEANTPFNKGRSGIVKSLDLANQVEKPKRPVQDLARPKEV